jgi:hypothetical protein
MGRDDKRLGAFEQCFGEDYTQESLDNLEGFVASNQKSLMCSELIRFRFGVL